VTGDNNAPRGRAYGCGGAFSAFRSEITYWNYKDILMSEQPITPQSTVHSRIGRVEALDVLKFFVLFFMIQGHLFRAYLLVSVRQSSWFKFHEVLHGIVAPGFLFAAGFAAFLSYTNKKEQYLRPGKAFFRRLTRILFIIGLGYWIHLPFFSLRKTLKHLHLGSAGEFLKVDILQCIGVGLLLFTLVAVLLKKQKMVVAVSALLALGFFLAAPLVYKLHLGNFIDYYLDYRLSLFPLFPWAGFLFAGVLCAYIYSWLEKALFFKLALILGIAFFPWSFLFPTTFNGGWAIPGLLTKFGGVFLLLWFSHQLASTRGRWSQVLVKAGKEPLFVYVLHLFIIFGSVFKQGLSRQFNNSLTVLDALLLCLVVQLLVFALALLYHEVKEKHPFTWRILFYLFWLVFFIFFFYRQY
jgi:acyltransferase